MGDTVSIPKQSGNLPHKPSPPLEHIPTKDEPTTPSHPPPPKLIDPPIKRKKSFKRCPQCTKESKKRKLTISNSATCDKCETLLCFDHIGTHDCAFDHHKHHQKLIVEKNPVINFKKIDKI